jgi:hypothetical protein
MVKKKSWRVEDWQLKKDIRSEWRDVPVTAISRAAGALPSP